MLPGVLSATVKVCLEGRQKTTGNTPKYEVGWVVSVDRLLLLLYYIFSLKGFFHVPNKLLLSFLFFKKFFLILPVFFFNSITQYSLEISKNQVVILWLLIRIHLNQNKINSTRTGTKSHPKLVFLFHRANRK